MEDLSTSIRTDEQKCAELQSFGKQICIFTARREYVAEMINIEKSIPSRTPETTQKLEEVAASVDEKIKMLESKMFEFLPCPVPLCTHNFKYKSVKRGTTGPLIRPAKLNPNASKSNTKDTTEFKITRKIAKNNNFPAENANNI
ncbi:hypothetical protein TNCT_398631 [Trichonephila clavata]|uniref:Uncharacterized protein n=1 Tax=Trichonephila clavata TaxID=2740835 RepID=A0A8X6M5M7_TRICU|nr:hypothetical protein TNCT_398631 [Trichonephila clavata]